MKALVYHGPGKRSWDTVADPVIVDATDAIVRVDATTICGTDLHIVKGDLPDVAVGRILGHEAVGTVVATVPGVRRVAVGDRVLVSCVTAAAPARRAARAIRASASAVAAGFSATSSTAPMPNCCASRSRTFHLPAPAGVADETVLMLADILPTSYEIGVLNGNVGPGDVVAVVGAGPVGIAAIIGRACSARQPSCRSTSPTAGSPRPSSRRGRHRQQRTRGCPRHRQSHDRRSGADVSIEAVGIAATFELAATLIRPGGHIANIGVHGGPATLHLEDLWDRNVTITTGLVERGLRLR